MQVLKDRSVGNGFKKVTASIAAMGLALLVVAPSVVQAASERAAVAASNANLPAVAHGLGKGAGLRVEGLAIPGLAASANLELKRFSVFADDATISVDGIEDGAAVPGHAYFRGFVDEDPSSVAVLSVHADGEIRGVVTGAGGSWVLHGGSGRGPLAAQAVDTANDNGQRSFECATQESAHGAGLGSAGSTEDEGSAGEPVTASTSHSYTARLALEADYELFTKFGDPATDPVNVRLALEIDYIGDLVAFSSGIYEAEISTSLLISRLDTYTSNTDPWNATSCGGALDEFEAYWRANRAGVDRTLAHLISGKNMGCGVAYLSQLCSKTYGYGVSAGLDGNFNPNTGSIVWDIEVFSHEVGHNFGSHHTHCYGGAEGPVDKCYGSEAGCYSGATSLPAGCPGSGNACGTIMSYCHFQSGNLSNIALTFGLGHPYGVSPDRVPVTMSNHVTSRAISNPGCLDLVPDGDQTLTVAVVGDGSVTSSPTGIDCGSDCDEAYPPGTVVTLTPAPGSGSDFLGWTGDSDCSDGVVTMDAARSCTATFGTLTTLNVSKAGSGSGTVTSSPSGINCGADCSETYTAAANVALTATPNSVSAFDGWSGDADCNDGAVNTGVDVSCVATFSLTCGNGVQEGSEECDGADLNGATCGGCDGSVTCSASCTLNFNGCTDGVCDGAETCGSCADDCQGQGATCGNGVCEVGDGENCQNCSADCNGKQNGKPSNRYCCGTGGTNPVGCGSGQCGNCTQDSAASCCGDDDCGGSENSFNCERDCGGPAVCGDNDCNGDETVCSCPGDCGTPPATETSCTDEVDNDCDGATDCADTADCGTAPACSSSCQAIGDSCTSASDCCSNKCKGRSGRKTCK